MLTKPLGRVKLQELCCICWPHAERICFEAVTEGGMLVGAGYGMGYDVSGHCPQLQFDGIRHSDWTVQWYVQCSGTHSTVVCTVQWCVQCSGMYSTVVRTVKWYAQYRSRTVNCHDRMDLQLMVQQTGTATWRSDPCDPSWRDMGQRGIWRSAYTWRCLHLARAVL